MLARPHSKGMHLISKAIAEFGDIQSLWTKPLLLSGMDATLSRHVAAATAQHVVEAIASSFVSALPLTLPSLPLRILMAEDNLVNQRVAQFLLAKLGYHADVANNGQEALSAMELKIYDCILMDIQMPKMDGLEATRRIRAQPSRFVLQPHIIAVTTSTLDTDRELCRHAGMDDFIDKPLSASKLARALSCIVAT
jgi:CheY-like chemotaxis protein